MLTTIIVAVILMRYSMNGIPLAIAYMVWTSLGILGTSLIGIYVLEEPLTIIKAISLAVIVIAVAGLRISSINEAAV